MLVATLQLIADEGIDAVRHRTVARMAGVSLGSTTYHFESREALIEAAFEYYLDRATEVLDGLASPVAGPADRATALVRYIEALLRREFGNPDLVRAEYELILYATRNPSLARRLGAWERARAAALDEFLGEAPGRRPSATAQMLIALIRGLELERLISPTRAAGHRARLHAIVDGLLSARVDE